MAFDNIPLELRQCVQWLCWRYEQLPGAVKPTKVPYDPRTGRHASTTDRNTWCSFDEAVKFSVWYNGIGFVFSPHDPYCGIDLDASTDLEILERQNRVFTEMNSYSETSPSGKGLHIIIKASVPHGRKRDDIEIYSESRFFTFTGNVYHNVPIAERQELASTLWEEMAPPDRNDNGFRGTLEQINSDMEVWEQAATAANAQKFLDLWNGNWSGYYKSQSEADYALIDIIAYYTTVPPQIVRMFRASGLGQRNKALRDKYLYPMVFKAFDNRPAEALDLSAILDRVESAKASPTSPVAHPTEALAAPGIALTGHRPARLDIDLDIWKTREPGGLLGLIADYVYRSAPLPVYEIALTAALGLMAGMCGRQFNVSGTGLNQYFMLIADTGKGKDAIHSGIGKLVTALTGEMKSAREFLGPSEIASGQALLKYLSSRNIPSFVSLLGEFGIRLKQLTSVNASPADRQIVRALLDLYAQSGAGRTVQPSIYADKANNTDPIQSPAFSLVGESTGENFYEALDETTVASGLLPRFLIIEYNGERPPLSNSQVDIPAQLLRALEMLSLEIYKMADTGTVQAVGMMDDASTLSATISEWCRFQINKASREVVRQLWNRVHLKILKIAALLAVSHNWQRPIIELWQLEWAASLVMTDTWRLLHKFDAGLMGQSNDALLQADYIRKELHRYVMTDMHGVSTVDRVLHQNHVISRSWLQQRLIRAKPFRSEKDPTAAFNRAITNLVENGVIARLSPVELAKITKKTGFHFVVLNMEWLAHGDG